jgi:drug/metabolite transporter (DMT)-like permease
VKKVYLYIIISAMLFGTMNTALKLGQNVLDPIQLTFLRFLIGGLVLLPPAVIELRSKERLSVREWLYMALLGFINVTVSMLLFQFGVNNMNASTSAVLFCINPVFTMLFACTLTDEVFTRNRLIAVLVAAAGFVAMARPWDLEPGNTLIGCLFMLLSAVTFSLYSVLGKKMIRRTGAISMTSFTFIIGSLFLLVPLAATGRPIVAGVTANLPLVLYVGIMVTGVGYLLYFMAIRGSDASTGSIVFFLKPAIAPVVAVVVLGEVLHLNSFVGIALILVSSCINMRESRRLAGTPCEKSERLAAARAART